MASADAVSQAPLKVGFIMVGPIADQGWNYAQEQGRLYLESMLHGRVETTMAERVPESAEVERVMEKMIAQGNRLIFATAYGYLEPAQRVAARHPEVIIMQCGRSNPVPAKNIGTYFINHYELAYVVGMVAGRITKKNEIGYVAAHPVPIILVSLNAFTLGVRSVNPKAKVHVIWTNTWSDPPTEAEAAKGLVDRGVDVLGSLESSTATVVQTAEKNHVYSVGDTADLHYLAPTGWLTGQQFDWGPLYVRIARSVIDHTWKADDKRYGVKDGVIKLSSFGRAVPDAVQKEAMQLVQKIGQRKLAIFCGPIKDRDGKEWIPKGQIAENSYLEQTNCLVEGIEGAMPGK
jgi:basic membrane protein A and related proteins